jgi:hypothetical protein
MNRRKLRVRESGCDAIDDVDWGRAGLGRRYVRPDKLVGGVEGLCEALNGCGIGNA